jgi:phosphatidylglycerophosphate synthase
MNDDSYKPLDRRPIASRDIGLFQDMAEWLAAKGVSPNAISFSSMFFGAAAGVALAATSYTEGWTTRILWIMSAAMIQLRLIANMLDGMVAIKSGKASPVGELYNEAPDRVSDAAIFVGAGYSVGGDVTLGFAAALLAVGVAYVRALGAFGRSRTGIRRSDGQTAAHVRDDDHRTLLRPGADDMAAGLSGQWLVDRHHRSYRDLARMPDHDRAST